MKRLRSYLPYFLTKLRALWEASPLILIVSLAAIARIVLLAFKHPLWWDSYVYIGMGKYLFSNGTQGIWEIFRPLTLPLLLGAGWKIGLSPIIFGKLLDFVFSLLVIYLTYKIAEKVFNKNIAIISSLIVAIIPLFMMFTGLILTEPLAMTFGLGAVYLIIKNTNIKNTKEALPKLQNRLTFFCSFFLSGILLGLSFMTKFPQGLFFGAIVLVLLFQQEKIWEKIQKITSLSLGFSIPVAIYLWFNIQHYHSAFEPLLAASWIVTTGTWLYNSSLTYYFTHFFLVNPILLFFFMYLYLFCHTSKLRNQNTWMIISISLLMLSYFALYIPRKEARYLVTVIPFLAMGAAYSLYWIYLKLKASPKPFINPQSFILLGVILLLIHIPTSLHFERAPSFEHELNLIMTEENITGVIIASDPSFVSFLDNKIVLLSGMDFAAEIYAQYRNQYQLIFVNSCDLPCPPSDTLCENRRSNLTQTINADAVQKFQKTIKNCTYTIYIKPSLSNLKK